MVILPIYKSFKLMMLQTRWLNLSLKVCHANEESFQNIMFNYNLIKASFAFSVEQDKGPVLVEHSHFYFVHRKEKWCMRESFFEGTFFKVHFGTVNDGVVEVLEFLGMQI